MFCARNDCVGEAGCDSSADPPDSDWSPGIEGAKTSYSLGSTVVSLLLILVPRAVPVKVVKVYGMSAVTDSNHCVIPRKGCEEESLVVPYETVENRDTSHGNEEDP